MKELQEIRLSYSGKSLLSFIVSKMIVFIANEVYAMLLGDESLRHTSKDERMEDFKRTKKARHMLAFVRNDLTRWETKLLVYMNGVDVEVEMKDEGLQ